MATSTFLDNLKRNDPKGFVRVAVGIQGTISASFHEDGSRCTRAEATRRFELSLQLVERMVMECSYSITRALDTLGTGLRARLDGVDWEPPSRNMWLGDQSVDVGDSTDEPLLWTPDRQRRGVMS